MRPLLEIREAAARAIREDSTPDIVACIHELGERCERAEAEARQAGLRLSSMHDTSLDAFNAIAKLCGCPEWDYPGQLVRDVEMLRDRAERAEALAEMLIRKACTP